jgi:hypothetical protein
LEIRGSSAARALLYDQNMMTKTIAALALLAALGTGSYAVSNDATPPKKTAIVEVTQLDWYVPGEEVDCEYGQQATRR